MARQYDVIDLEKRLSFALGLLPELSVLTLKDFGATAGKQIKADGSLVTSADQFIESWLRRSIEASFQDDGILGEELGETASRSGYTWTIDPIDGTDSFVKGVPLFGNMIGIKLGDGTPVLGVVQLPALGEALYAIRGQGAFWRPRLSEPFKPCHALSKTIVGSVTVCYSDESYFAFHKVVPFLNELRSKNWTLRTWGDCYGHVLVATGRVHAMIDPFLYAWDMVPLKVIIEEAGGVFPGWNSNRDAAFFLGVSASQGMFADLEPLIEKYLR